MLTANERHPLALRTRRDETGRSHRMASSPDEIDR